jgi:hypothetical protein
MGNMVDSEAPDELTAAILDDTTTVARAAPRPLGLLLLLAGFTHLVAPGVLLWLAAVGYDRVLAVEFEPGERATSRVRALGIAMVLAGGHLLYHGSVIPE